MENQKDRIVGVKAIANYLDISIRNLYRWEKDLGLPLRRISGSKGRSVYILIKDLEEWRKKDKIKTKYSKLYSKIVRRIAFFILPILLVGAIILILGKSEIDDIPQPTTYTIKGKYISIRDQKGNEIWSYLANNADINAKILEKEKNIDFIDLDKDGANEVISSTYETNNDKFYITLFDNDGTLLWERDITSNQKFNGIRLRSDFRPNNVSFAHSKNGSFYAITCWVHRGRFLSLISNHDHEGNLENIYHHVGNLGSMRIYDLDGDGTDEILFAGTNNLLNGEGVLGVLPLTEFHGISPPNRIGAEYKQLSFKLKTYLAENYEPGNQILYLRFKRTNHLAKYRRKHAFAGFDNIDDNIIHVKMFPWLIEEQNKNIHFGFLYAFNAEFKLNDVISVASLDKLFPESLQRKEVDISFEKMQEIYSKNISRWENGNWIPVTIINE
jgi:hypothetical protein